MIEAQKHPFKADYHLYVFEVPSPMWTTRQMGVNVFKILLILRYSFCDVKEDILSVCQLQTCVLTKRALRTAISCLQDVVNSER